MATRLDPVCEMKVDDQTAAAQSTHEGKTYYFCGAGCKSKFDGDPEQYAD